MKLFNSKKAFENLGNGWADKTSSLPQKPDHSNQANGQYDGVGYIPKHNGKFTFSKGEKVFTIGSCFAREIESHLIATGFDVPVKSFAPTVQSFPSSAPPPTTHLLNEYNLGTMLQRVEEACGLFEYPADCGKQPDFGKFIDLFLHPQVLPVSDSDFIIRRNEIKQFYKELLDSDIVIITLGLIECWYDNKYDIYLNKTPSRKYTAQEPDRFEFHQLTYEEVMEKTERMIALLNQHGKQNKRILLTVSPVPLDATFTGQNCILATSYSKAVLRVVAEQMYKKYDFIDYFPSYEIVTSRGCNGGYTVDNVHIPAEVVEKVMTSMINCYLT